MLSFSAGQYVSEVASFHRFENGLVSNYNAVAGRHTAVPIVAFVALEFHWRLLGSSDIQRFYLLQRPRYDNLSEDP